MRAIALASTLLFGCFSPKIQSGQLKCGAAAHPCPDGFYCAGDGTCWQNGSAPNMGAMPDMAGCAASANGCSQFCTWDTDSWDNGCTWQ
jgi:hypothetical protein